MKPVMLLLLSFAAWCPVHAQLCDGTLRFRLTDSVHATGSAVVVSFMRSSDAPYQERLVSTDGMFEALVSTEVPGEEKRPFATLRPAPEQPYTTFRYGCSGAYTLRFVRHQRDVGADTMTVHLDNACDAFFGLNIAYSSGVFRALVCDTTKLDLALGKGGVPMSYRYRTLDEQYPRMLYGGYDITGILRKEDHGR